MIWFSVHNCWFRQWSQARFPPKVLTEVVSPSKGDMRWFDDQYFAVRGLVYTLSISCESCYCGSSSYIQEVLWRCLNDCRGTRAMILECPGVSCWTKFRPHKASLWGRQHHSWPSITLSLRRVFRRDHPPLKLAIRETTERGTAVPSVHKQGPRVVRFLVSFAIISS